MNPGIATRPNVSLFILLLAWVQNTVYVCWADFPISSWLDKTAIQLYSGIDDELYPWDTMVDMRSLSLCTCGEMVLIRSLKGITAGIHSSHDQSTVDVMKIALLIGRWHHSYLKAQIYVISFMWWLRFHHTLVAYYLDRMTTLLMSYTNNDTVWMCTQRT